ncbi:MAG: hypothetical protein ACE5GV_00335 [Candidatus Scalindua sp.]
MKNNNTSIFKFMKYILAGICVGTSIYFVIILWPLIKQKEKLTLEQQWAKEYLQKVREGI